MCFVYACKIHAKYIWCFSIFLLCTCNILCLEFCIFLFFNQQNILELKLFLPPPPPFATFSAFPDSTGTLLVVSLTTMYMSRATTLLNMARPFCLEYWCHLLARKRTAVKLLPPVCHRLLSPAHHHDLWSFPKSNFHPAPSRLHILLTVSYQMKHRILNLALTHLYNVAHSIFLVVSVRNPANYLCFPMTIPSLIISRVKSRLLPSFG